MIDLTVKMTVVAAVAWMATRRLTPANAAAAHRVWLAVAASPALWLLGEYLFVPVAYARLRTGLLPMLLEAPSPDLWRTLTLVYATGVSVLLLRTGFGVLSVRRMLRQTRPMPSADLARLRAIGGGAHTIREGDLDVPVTAGFISATVVLPVGWRALPPAGLEAILRHEAAHVRRRDCAVALACAVLEALFWFNPVVWIAGRQVRWFAEMACDAEAARAMDDKEYAAELLSLAARWSGAPRPRYAITAGAETDVATRIRLLLDELEHGPRHRARLPIIAVLVLLGVPLAASVRVGETTQRSPSDAPNPQVLMHQHQHRHYSLRKATDGSTSDARLAGR